MSISMELKFTFVEEKILSWECIKINGSKHWSTYTSMEVTRLASKLDLLPWNLLSFHGSCLSFHRIFYDWHPFRTWYRGPALSPSHLAPRSHPHGAQTYEAHHRNRRKRIRDFDTSKLACKSKYFHIISKTISWRVFSASTSTSMDVLRYIETGGSIGNRWTLEEVDGSPGNSWK